MEDNGIVTKILKDGHLHHLEFIAKTPLFIGNLKERLDILVLPTEESEPCEANIRYIILALSCQEQLIRTMQRYSDNEKNN